MSRLDWWLGIALLVAAIVFHAIFPRYEIQLAGEARSNARGPVDRRIVAPTWSHAEAMNTVGVGS